MPHLPHRQAPTAPTSARRRAMPRAAALTTAATLVAALISAAPAGAAELPPAADGAWRFDFGTATSPVAEGYQQALTSSLYSVEAGWGITLPDGVTLFDRNRTGSRTPADPLAEDFVAGVNWGFALDGVPEGDYDVTVTIGDALPNSSGTNATVTLEGAAQTRQTTARGATTTATFRTTVTDGQLTAGFTGSGLGAYLNGLVVAPVVPAAPADLTATRVAWNGVDLTWSAADGAATYDVLRADVIGDETGAFAPIAEATDAAYRDTTVVSGSSYAYAVVGVSAYDRASPPSAEVRTGVIPELVAPAAPGDVAVAQVTRDSVVLSWSAVPNGDEYVIERAPAGGAFAPLATVATAGHTDTGVDTSTQWQYRVTARNQAGSSAASTVVTSDVYAAPAPLPDADVVTFDFGPGQVAAGALGVTSTTAYNPEWGYGFSTAPTAAPADVDRGGADALRGDFVAASGSTFEIDLEAGDYVVSLIAGDQTAASDIAITAESIAKVLPTTKVAGEFLEMAFPIALVDGTLTMQITGTATALNALTITRQADRTPGTLTTAYLTGDSTVQTYDPGYAPQAGWGQMIGRFLAPDVVVANNAIGGRSSKNFITQGRLDEVLRAIRPGDYLFVQFGHNDATQGVDDRYASPADYKEYLRVYVEGARQRGATPIIVTPVSRRSFDAATGQFNVSFPEYVAKATELAVEEDVLLVDLSASSRAYLNEIGPEAAKAVFLHVDPGVFPGRPAGTIDDTHFQDYGAIQMARLIAQDVAELDDPLAAKVIDIAPPAAVPAVPTNLVAGSISNAGAQLRWDASPGADIYKVYRQAVADPEPAWSLVTYTTQTSVIVQGLVEGAAYRYQVVATNGLGDSAASSVVTFTTKQARWKFDFQLAGNPVMPGYTEVNPNTGYTAELGYGFEVALPANAGRDRGTVGGANDLQRDFVLPGDSSTFALDVPNGTYSVKTYSGDWIGSTRTSFDLEGRAFGTGNAGSGAVNESVRGPVLVTDGQLSVRAYGAAAGTRLNGIEVTPILLGPVGLEVTEIDADPSAPKVSLEWDAEAGVTYKVYRQSPFDTDAVLVGEVSEAAFTDTTARVGLDYDYHVTAVDQTDLESVPSATVEVSFVDVDVSVPAAPTALEVQRIDKRELEIGWTAPANALYSLVFRSEVDGEQGELVGIADEPTYTDTDVLTTIPYFYTVVAVNAGGPGAASAQLETEAVTILQRQAEYLDRAPHANATDDGVLVTWRMLGTDPDEVAFHVYRDGARITETPITDSTNLLDEEGAAASEYVVTTVLGGVETTETEPFGVQDADYLSVPLQKPADAYTKDGQPYTYSASDSSVGDVDGDGQYELIVKWEPSNAKDNSQAGYTGNVYLDAYRLDGTRLWRIDMGVNIRAGAHYTQFQVFDLNGDGRAEVTMKTADGTIDGAGQPIGNASADHRNSSGYVLQGPEFLTVFDGLDGRAIDTIDYTPPRGDVGSWGDAYGNRVDRFLAGVAYLDGEKPSVVFSRGYYTRAVVSAYDFDGTSLTERWVLDTDDEGNESLYGQGNHNLAVADVDGDAKDEIVFGSATIDDDGTVLYSTDLGHGDALHVSDLVPSNPGLEVFAAHEDMGSSGNRGATMRDARTGDILWDIPAARDTGRAASADIDPRHEGAEGWAIGGDAAWNSPVGQLKSSTGELIAEKIPAANFLAWFDGDPLREIVDHSWDAATSQGTPTIGKWNWETETTDNLVTADGARSNNSTKGTPNIQADLFGDWREEIAWRSADSSELRIYSTTDETDLRIRTLMHDAVYRLSVAWQNTSYNQPTQTSFFLGDGMVEPPAPRIAVTGGPAGGTDTTAPTVTGVPADPTTVYEHQDLVLAIAADDAESGIRSFDVTFDGVPVAPTATIDLAGLSGERVLTVRAVDNAGLVTESSVRIVVSVDKTRPVSTLVAPTSGLLRELAVQVDATDAGGLSRIVANIYRGSTLVRSTQTRIDGATSGSHTATVALPDGTYTVKYNAQDAAGNISVTRTFDVTIDATVPVATAKVGDAYTVARGAGYDLISFKLFDAGKIDRVVLNGKVKDLTDNTWSDVNFVKPGVFGAVQGLNTLVVHDVAGNTRTVEFTLN
ncbi:fibronectin type III domain-containing protein [Planococcus sp. APC 4015]|nr:fibronectin type III domain-containing protein [Planococcus sp. APC 4015]